MRSFILILIAVLGMPSAASAQTITKFRISGEVTDSAWIILYADFDVQWPDGRTRRVSYALASGSVGALVPDSFDFADGTRELVDNKGIFLRAEPASGTPYGTVYWDCLVLDKVHVGYKTTATSKKKWESIDIKQPISLVPQPTGDKTNCTGERTVRLY